MGANEPRFVLIDGYNLLHAIPRFAPRGSDPAPARVALERWLAQTAQSQRVAKCVVVWDGDRDSRTPRSPRPLEVVYSGRDQTADDRLLEMCRGPYASKASQTWVVSSDHGVQTPARELGFHVLGTMTFFRSWESASRGSGRSSKSGQARSRGLDHRPSRAEVEELLGEMLAQREDDDEP